MTLLTEAPYADGNMNSTDYQQTLTNGQKTFLESHIEADAPAIDLGTASHHIDLLTGAADKQVTLVAIRHNPSTGKALATSRRGTLKALTNWIVSQQKSRAGIYVTVNQTAGVKRKTEDILEIRAVWSDDDVPRESPRTDWPLPPHLTIETSPGKYHYYWMTCTQPGAEFDGVMQCLVKKHGCDRNAVDSARVLRLAGTFNLKNPEITHCVRIVSSDIRPKYLWAEILAAFPPERKTDGTIQAPKLDVSEAIGILQTGSPGMHDALLKLSSRMAAKGLERGEVEAYLHSVIAAGGAAHRKDRLSQIPEAVRTAFDKFGAGGFFDTKTGGVLDPLDMFSARPAQIDFVPTDYPPTIAALAVDIALRMGCDPKIPAFTALVAIAALAPDRFTLRPKARDYTWKESARLWVAHVGPPSSKKTPPIAAVLAPIYAVQKRAYATFQQQTTEWEQLAADAKKDKLPEPIKPILARVIVGDATTEALVTVCRDNSEGVLVVHDELTGFFGAMDAYRQNGATKDRSLWLQTYNGGPFMVDRASKGTTFVSNLSASMLGGIQPEPMRRIASKLDDDGLMQRFIMLLVTNATDGMDRAPDAAAAQAWEDLVHEIYKLRDSCGEGWPESFRLSADAQKAVDAARSKITALARSPGVDSRLASALAKGEGQLIRLILTFHLIEDRTDHCLFRDGNVPSEYVSLTSAARVIRLYFNLIVPSMYAFYGDLVGVSPTHEHARWVAGFILASGSVTISERDISRAYRSLRGDNTKREIADCMALLELASWVSPIERPGKPPKEWSVNGAVHSKFVDRAILERERREHERAEISRLAKA